MSINDTLTGVPVGMRGRDNAPIGPHELSIEGFGEEDLVRTTAGLFPPAEKY
ncbi:hypothetical protein [Bradyrhizobium sp. LHD-71]|uniref:hypothetical protein n=1 Tax=Bradyrhizobium sp. LHD-71 TaxID=3072141 RepID=UPI00280CD715|nr:hypothetical protein [Bradyrhizobium sp. LHD-71]MDQ8732053.1 hypothetical protein [Bradyrhizobium sp. LHD-71]